MYARYADLASAPSRHSARLRMPRSSGRTSAFAGTKVSCSMNGMTDSATQLSARARSVCSSSRLSSLPPLGNGSRLHASLGLLKRLHRKSVAKGYEQQRDRRRAAPSQAAEPECCSSIERAALGRAHTSSDQCKPTARSAGTVAGRWNYWKLSRRGRIGVHGAGSVVPGPDFEPSCLRHRVSTFAGTGSPSASARRTDT